MNLDLAQERSARAGEYVLGTLDPQERAQFEQALAEDGELQAEVYAWQDRLMGLGARIPAEPLPPGLWPRIEAGLVAAKAAPPPAAQTPSRGAANDPLWQRLRRWQAFSAAALAASVLMASVLWGGRPAADPERYLALLQSPDQHTAWVVEGTAGGELRLIPVGDSPAAPPGKTLQFWTKPQGAAGPTSLGLVRVGQTVVLPSTRLPGLGEQQLFELTLEPEGGSPLNRPTGPVLYIGRTLRL